MITLDQDVLQHHLKSQFGILIKHVEVAWEPCVWSQTVRVVDTQNNVYFLKGTPRTRPEALITQLLNEYDSHATPRVMGVDVLPDHEWCWFLMPDMGATDYNSLSLDVALQTANALGRLQHHVMGDSRLSQLMPHCLPSSYLNIIYNMSLWIERAFPEPASDLVEMMRLMLPARKRFFDEITSALLSLSPTCVHGDLWSGNVAIHKKQICLLDWGDSVWGIGTSSVVNLLFTLEDTGLETDVWNAYAEGYGQKMSEEVVRASQVAWNMTNLVTERQLAALQLEKTIVPIGIRPILEELILLSA